MPLVGRACERALGAVRRDDRAAHFVVFCVEAAKNASGEIFLSHTRLDGRYVLRLAIGNFRTTEDDVRLAWDVLRRESRP